MAKPWQKTEKKGVRFYTLSDRPRLRNGNEDRCWGFRYQFRGTSYEAILGWSSEGWTIGKAADEREYYIESVKAGGPATPLERAQQADFDRKEKERKQKAEAFKNIAFQDFAEGEYFPGIEGDVKDTTLRDYKDHCRLWLNPVIGDKAFHSITVADLNKIKTKMRKKGRSPRTIQAVFVTFKMLWAAAQESGIINKICPTKMKTFRMPKVDNSRERFLTFEEADKLLAAIKKRSQQAHDIALLSLHTGMRFGEIAALTFQCVDLENNIIRVLNAKGNKSRNIEMGGQVRELFKLMKWGKRGDLVFPGRRGQLTYIPSSFKRAVNDVGLNDGITDPKLRFSFHGLRHTRASWLRKAGADLYTIQEILGHASPVMSQRYAHIEHREIKTATGAVDQMLEAAKSDDKEKIVPIKKKA